MRMRTLELIDLLRKVVAVVQVGDSLGGSLTYEATNIPPFWEVRAQIRVGNQFGQGSMLIIETTREERRMTPTEHVKWAKERALHYVESDRPQLAVSSFSSDMLKHDDTLRMEGMMDHLKAGLSAVTAEEIRRWMDVVQADVSRRFPS